jgi:hypothetical protein
VQIITHLQVCLMNLKFSKDLSHLKKLTILMMGLVIVLVKRVLGLLIFNVFHATTDTFYKINHIAYVILLIIYNLKILIKINSNDNILCIL